MKALKTIGIILLLLFLSSSLIKNIVDYRSKQGFYEDYKKHYEEEKHRNAELKTALLKKNDLNEIEKIIRNKLNLLRPGETSVILPSPTPVPVIITPTPPPNWKQWTNLYLH